MAMDKQKILDNESLSYDKLIDVEEGDSNSVKSNSCLERNCKKIFKVLIFICSYVVISEYFFAPQNVSLVSDVITDEKQMSWSIPNIYTVNVELFLPYSGLVQNAKVSVNNDLGYQRIEYYNGRNVYFKDLNGPSFTIAPSVDHTSCFYDIGKEEGGELQDIFPGGKGNDFSKTWKKTSSNPVEIDGKPCDVYQYIYNYENDISAADKDGYIGTYKFYVSTVDNSPVRMDFIGHNVFLGGSHFDKYSIVYSNFTSYKSLPSKYFINRDQLNTKLCKNVKETDPSESESDEAQNARRWAQIHATDGEANVDNWNILFPGEDTDSKKEEMYREYLSKYKSAFINSAEKDNYRKFIFHENRRHILVRNRQNLGYQLELNHFAHLHDYEVSAYTRNSQMLKNKPSSAEESLCQVETTKQIKKEMKNGGLGLPAVVDYWSPKANPLLTLPPGDQGTCGSCWTFGATGALESAVAKVTGNLKALSKQNILDCAKNAPYNNNGCNGGSDYKAYEWVINNNNGTMIYEKAYPYENQDGFCSFDLKRGINVLSERSSFSVKDISPPVKITDCFIVTERFLNDTVVSTHDSVESFKYKLATQGPLAISINAKPKDFYFYKSGIYSSSECKGNLSELDHAVLAVGYNLKEDYMVLKNSWSTYWGEGGFARVKLSDNTCGFATVPTYVKAQ